MKEETLSPFRLIQHSDSWSLTLVTDDDALSLLALSPDELELDEDLEYGGYFWDALAQYHLHSGRVELEDEVGFDSASSMFCMYSSSESALRRFAESFKEACADPETLKEMLQGFGEYLDY